MLDSELAFFRSQIGQTHGDALQRGEGLPEGAISGMVRGGPFSGLDEPSLNFIIRELETSFTVTQRRGAVISKGHRPWLAARKPSTDFYYWNRLRKYYLETGILPSKVLATLDVDTDQVLDYCGDPLDLNYGFVRGMVMGNVQSGKTTNYSALICKAADAGYKVIILLAGITNSLRTQTQERIDETFIGKVSVFMAAAQKSLPIQNYAATRRIPSYGTSRDADFSTGHDGIFFNLSGHHEPMIFVTKKNKSVLERLEKWIDEQSETGGYDLPLLLIDDEADNASINTHKDPTRTTAINRVIRQVLNKFPRSAYVGYTATPFANIFIDPETTEEMENDNLFPANFIKALDPPSNYVGSHRVFREDGNLRSTMVRVIDDYRTTLPLNHKSGDPVVALPESLSHAVRVFCITRAIRVMQGKGSAHCSMMINVSRFNSTQETVLGLVYKYLSELKDAISVHGSLPADQINDDDMAAIKTSFENEYTDNGFAWREVVANLNPGVQSIEVRTVNMRGGQLDYSLNRENGLHVIAIGGLALSRGLTLEGLTVSYLLRNTAASDTLMQMARWFGYRPGYEDICRLYLPEVSLNHYEYVDEATEELRSEVKRMQDANRTPADFGLKVRQSSLAIRVTAANKMRTAKLVTIAQDYSARHVEGYALLNDADVNRQNMEQVDRMLRSLGAPADVKPGYVIWRGVEGRKVVDLIRNFSFGQHVDLQPIADRSLFQDYVQDRIADELAYWDIAIPMRRSGQSTEIGGVTVLLRDRDQGTVRDGVYRVYGGKNRVADPGDAWIDLTEDQRATAEERIASGEYRRERSACSVRKRPLAILHFFNAKLTTKPEESGTPSDLLKIENPVVTLSFCMRETHKLAKARSYQVNAVYRKQLELFEEPDDDEELINGDQDAG